MSKCIPKEVWHMTSVNDIPDFQLAMKPPVYACGWALVAILEVPIVNLRPHWSMSNISCAIKVFRDTPLGCVADNEITYYTKSRNECVSFSCDINVGKAFSYSV